jgi:steroid 5-alpha reductase family enzyme
LFALCVGLAFLIQWIVFIPACLFQTEKFFDLTGSLTHISVIFIAVAFGNALDVRTILLALLVVWAVRLGFFLFRRIQKAGKDDRFDEIKPSFMRFLNVWTIQALWVTFTMAFPLVAITTSTRKGLDLFTVVGFLI